MSSIYLRAAVGVVGVRVVVEEVIEAHCSTPQHTAAHCSTLQHAALTAVVVVGVGAVAEEDERTREIYIRSTKPVHMHTQQHIATRYNTLQRTATRTKPVHMILQLLKASQAERALQKEEKEGRSKEGGK